MCFEISALSVSFVSRQWFCGVNGFVAPHPKPVSHGKFWKSRPFFSRRTTDCSASLVHLFNPLFSNLQRLASLSPLSLPLTKLKQTRRICGGEEADRRRRAMRDAAPARRPPHPYFPTPRLSSPPPAPLQHSSPTPCAPSSVRSEVGLYWSFVCFVFIVNELGVIWLACLVC